MHTSGSTALLIIDMISVWDFPDGEKLLPQGLEITAAISALRARCNRAGLPVIYANDNRGKWQSHFPRIVQSSVEAGGAAKTIAIALLPTEQDYFVLKPRQSAFFGTPLELLLAHLGVRRLILAGVSSDQCVLMTAIEARMRDLELVVPRDCVASQSRARNDTVIAQLEEAHKIPTTPGRSIRLKASVQRRRSTASTTG